MSRAILRAADQNLDIQRVAFNFDDMASQAKKYLDGIRGEAAKILQAAQKEGEVIKKKAEADGRASGMQQVEQMVQQRVAQQMGTLVPALREAITQIGHAKQAWLAHWEKSAVHVATAIAGRIVRHELAADPKITLKLVHETLELAAGSPQVRIHLHPNDHRSLGAEVQTMIKEFAGLGNAELIADPNITPGGCRVETQFGIIDQQIETQMARIEEELT